MLGSMVPSMGQAGSSGQTEMGVVMSVPQGVVTADLYSGGDVTLTIGYLNGAKTLAVFIGGSNVPVLIDADVVIEALTMGADDDE